MGRPPGEKASEKSLGRRAGLRVAALDMGPLPSPEWSVFLRAVDLIQWFTSGVIRCKAQNLEHRQCGVVRSGLQYNWIRGACRQRTRRRLGMVTDGKSL